MYTTPVNKNMYKFRFIKRGLLLRFFDVLFSLGGIVLIFNFTDSAYFSVFNPQSVIWLLTFVVYFLIIGEIFELYHSTKNADTIILIRNILLTTLVTILLYLFTPKITPVLPSKRIEVFFLFIGITFPLIVWRLIHNALFYRDLFLKNIVFIGSEDEILKTMNLIEIFSLEHKVVVYISNKEIDYLKECIFYPYNSIELSSVVQKHKIRTILISELFDKSFSVGFSGQLIQLFKKGVSIESFHEFNEKLSKRLSKKRFNDTFYNYFTISKYNQDSIYVGFISVLDFLISLFGIALLIMLIPVIMVLNLFFNKGPLFYSQDRIGHHGEVFKIYKLRTMRVGAEQGKALWASKNDIRATAFGHFLRKTRIDEMPQFINILKREMNIIGPRPERPEFVEMLEAALPYYGMRHVIKPGLTGWAQVEYPYANSIPDQEMKLRYDLYYIKERTPLLDFKIILKTINTVLFYKGY